VYLDGWAEVTEDFDARFDMREVIEVHDHVVARTDPLGAQDGPDFVKQTNDGRAEVPARGCTAGSGQRPWLDVFKSELVVRHFAEG
jgi:hypothetical protein